MTHDFTVICNFLLITLFFGDKFEIWTEVWRPLYKEFWIGDGGDDDEDGNYGLKFKVMYVLMCLVEFY